jgi:hypothetical protein
MPGTWRPAAAVVVSLLVLALVAGCTGPGGPAHGTRQGGSERRPVAAGDLDASVTQTRFDEGSARLRAGVVNHGRRDVTVTRATLAWDGFGFSTVRLPADPVHPGQAAAFTVEYRRPRCDSAPTQPPVLVAVVDGRTRRLPLHVDVPGLLVRLHAAACARARLDRQAEVGLRLARATDGAGAAEHLPGRLVVSRPTPGPSQPRAVRLLAVRGSVLFDLSAVRRLPAVLRRDQPTLEVPLTVGSTQRCDGHARGQASQPFLLAAYLRVGAATAQRVVLVPSASAQQRLLAMLDRVCRSR